MADTDFSLAEFEEEDTVRLIQRNKEIGWPDIPHQKKAFAHEYILNGYNHREAAKEVGIAASSGIRVLREPLVSAYVAHLQETNFTSQIITKQFVEHQYLELIPFLKGEREIPIVTGSGAEIDACKFHGSELVAVLRDLSKITGYQKEEENNKNLVNIEINFGAVLDNREKVINGKVQDDS